MAEQVGLLLLAPATVRTNPDAKRLYDDLLSNYNRSLPHYTFHFLRFAAVKVDPARGEQHGQDHSQDGPQALPAGGPGKNYCEAVCLPLVMSQICVGTG